MILVFAETNGKISKAALEAASYGANLAKQNNTSCTLVTYGNNNDLNLFAKHGINKILQASALQNPDSAQLSKLVVAAAEKENASTIIFSHDLTGRAVAPRVAARLNAGLVSGAVALPEANTIKVNVFSGKAAAYVEVLSDKKVISVMPNSVGITTIDTSINIESFNPETGTAKVIVKETKKNEGEISLPEAELVVSGGRGLKGPENWGMIEELAKLLGAATACSRPVADIGWRPHHEHVGQTGIAIAPNLYIAIGISGAIQHLAGVNRSKVIVVINTDAEAPFFKAADYGIVGDAFEVVPKLIESVKKFKAAAN
jgi:electron transfer flavoprotein alpha subunit